VTTEFQGVRGRGAREAVVELLRWAIRLARRYDRPIVIVLGVIGGSFWLGNALAQSPEIGVAFAAGIVVTLLCVWVISREKAQRHFLLSLFVGGLLLRWALACLIYYKDLQAFLGGDATTYDSFGYALAQSWRGLIDPNAPWLVRYTQIGSSGWGMFYFVGSVYYLIGQNPLAIQLIDGALGAISCVAIYKIALLVYPRQRVAKTAAVLTAFAPSMVLWSSQALKDAPIVLCLCLCMLYTLKLRNRFDLRSFLLLLLFLICLYSLRHYAFYIVFATIAVTFLFGWRKITPLRVLQGGLLVIVIGITLAYIGAGDTAQQSFDLKRIQEFRAWGARVTNTGFGGDVDISDPEAALGFLPIGITYVLLAPFPWMINNLRQLITLPELVIWWVMMPMLIRGYWFAIRHRLKESFAICIFTAGLIVAYALYQSNVGTAYRHRAQLYGFFFVFMSIGLELRRTAKARRRYGFRFQGAEPLMPVDRWDELVRPATVQSVRAAGGAPRELI
jgi:Dolichyl-phosphate-mannose-protein mannosyltransferase